MIRKYDWKVFGWLTPFFIPIAVAGKLAGSWESNVTPPEYPAHEWEELKWCNCIADEVVHLYLTWRDEGIVTVECTLCGNTQIVEDREP